jgi:hypothetical protein
VSLSVEGATATLDVPISTDGERLKWIQALGTFQLIGFNVNQDSLRDFPALDISPVPLVYLGWPEEGDGLPLMAFPRFPNLADSVHSFSIAPWGGLDEPIQVGPAQVFQCPYLPGADVPAVYANGGVVTRRTPNRACREAVIQYGGLAYVLLDARLEGEVLPTQEPPSIVTPAPVPPKPPVSPPAELKQGDLSLSLNSLQVVQSYPVARNGQTIWAHRLHANVTISNVGQLRSIESLLLANTGRSVLGDRSLTQDERGQTRFSELPDGLEYVNLFDDDEIGALIPMTYLPPLDPGETTTFLVDLVLFGSDPRSMLFAVDSDDIDDVNPVNNIVVTTAMLPEPQPLPDPELEVEVTGPDGPVQRGQLITVTVTVRNRGGSPATDVGLLFTTKTIAGMAGWIRTDNPGVYDPLTEYDVKPPHFDLEPGEEYTIEIPMTAYDSKPVKAIVTADAPDGRPLVALDRLPLTIQ